MTAIVVAAVGLIVVVVGLLTPASFGWFAHQPLSDATFAPGGSVIFVPRTTVIGAVVLGLGVAGLAFLAGWRAAMIRQSRRTH